MNRKVVNYVNGAGWYKRGQDRLRASMKMACSGVVNEVEFIGFTDNRNFGSPTHQQVPYAFKTWALMYCLNKGYDRALWADSSIWAVKSWDPIWDIIDSQGFFGEEAGHYVGVWTKDSVLARFGVTRDEAMTIPMFTAGFTGINLKHPVGIEFLTQWHKYAQDGDSFHGTWGNEVGQMSKDPRCRGHRHDMSVASLIAWKMGLKLNPGGMYLAYIGKGYSKPNDTVVAFLQPPK